MKTLVDGKAVKFGIVSVHRLLQNEERRVGGCSDGIRVVIL